MTYDELIEHQMECLKIAQDYQFLQLFDKENNDLKQGIELLLRFADRAKYRAMRIEAGYQDPLHVIESKTKKHNLLYDR